MRRPGKDVESRIRRAGGALALSLPAGLMALFVAGCAVTPLPPNRSLVPNPVPSVFDDRPWADCLRETVKEGLVDYDHLAAHREPLETFAALISVAGPTGTPEMFATPEARLAYWINAYNACVLRAVLHQYPTESVHSFDKPSLLHGFRFQVDRRMMTLAAIQQAVFTEAGDDFRPLFALCMAAGGSPPLADRPYRAATLPGQLNDAARQAMEDPKIVRIDHDQRVLRVAWDIFNRKADLIASFERRTGTRHAALVNTLLDFASEAGRRRLNSAVGYAVEAIPFDRSLNRWKPSPDEGSPSDPARVTGQGVS